MNDRANPTVLGPISGYLARAQVTRLFALALFVVASALAANNSLSPEEAASGYELLWNGKDLSGWRLNNSRTNPGDPSFARNWAIVRAAGLERGDTVKSEDPDSNVIEIASSGFSLFTADTTYRDFDWKAEWRTPPNNAAVGGLLYHFRNDVSTDMDVTASTFTVMNGLWVQEWRRPSNTAGTDYDLTPLLPARSNPDHSPSWTRPTGEWNQVRIISYGGRTAHYGNGVRLLEYRKGSAAYDSAYALSKFTVWPVHKAIHAGSLMLQVHGQKWISYRNLRVKRLARDPWAPDSPYLNKTAAAAGDTSLVDTLDEAASLFPTPVQARPHAIAPKVAARVMADGNGLRLEFSETGDYVVTIGDLQGARFSVHRIHAAREGFIPGRFSRSPRILAVWQGDKKVWQSIIGRE